MPSLNPFLAFWNDFYTKMVAAGLAPGKDPQDAAEQMRRSFFDAMSQYADEFLRSEVFLKAMKQSFDNVVAMQGDQAVFAEGPGGSSDALAGRSGAGRRDDTRYRRSSFTRLDEINQD